MLCAMCYVLFAIFYVLAVNESMNKWINELTDYFGGVTVNVVKWWKPFEKSKAKLN